MITEMDTDGANGICKLKILPIVMGNICKTLLESGVKLGVSTVQAVAMLTIAA